MIKKRTAILFILLANIILLAHAVVPHHHHKSQVCINPIHCQTDNDANHHKTSEHSHEHDGKESANYCILKQVVVLPSNLAKQFDGADNQSLFVDFQAVLSDNWFKAFVPIFATNNHAPLITSSYIHFVISSSGLRAPPSV